MSSLDKNEVKLNSFKPSLKINASKPKQIIWLLVNVVFFKSSLPYPSFIKVFVLKLFGCKIGQGITLKPNINIKYPWKLSIGDHSWIGEGVWIDNLVEIEIESNVCISQGAYLLTGNHDYKKSTFDLITGTIVIKKGAWVGAKSVVCPNVVLGSHSIVTVGSVVTKSTEPFGIYSGNPAFKIRTREILN